MSSLGNLELTVTGKIQQVNSSEGYNYTVLVSPAVDAYSFPPMVRIRSKKTIGRIGDEVSDLHCRVSGWKRTFNYTNKQTGQQERGSNIDMILDVVE
ncbi:DNA-binding protein G5P [Candidatus Pantoea formicae]|uniref:DNA-binding protein G5P n=1 Tax=Candidatus Pantoea formicae TaxID=2608355 RepID=UPI003ED96CF8